MREIFIIQKLEELSNLKNCAAIIDCGEGEFNFLTIKEKIRFLILKNIKFFLFVGKNSEEWHDFADDVIIEDNLMNFITTFHLNETFFDLFYFFESMCDDNEFTKIIIKNNLLLKI